jgi:hypothetical protein
MSRNDTNTVDTKDGTQPASRNLEGREPTRWSKTNTPVEKLIPRRLENKASKSVSAQYSDQPTAKRKLLDVSQLEFCNKTSLESRSTSWWWSSSRVQPIVLAGGFATMAIHSIVIVLVVVSTERFKATTDRKNVL